MNKIYTPKIDYQKIADAQRYYTSCGFQEIAVPWILDYEAYDATRPPGRREFYSLDGYLNASGEQSFLELMLGGTILTKNMCVTSCFRDEAVVNDIHHRYFVKLELINTEVSVKNLKLMIKQAKTFLDQYLLVPTRVITTDDVGQTFDIVDGVEGIELGSYGIRSYKHLSWIYGTGVAQPRLDTVITKIKEDMNV